MSTPNWFKHGHIWELFVNWQKNTELLASDFIRSYRKLISIKRRRTRMALRSGLLTCNSPALAMRASL